MQLTFATVALAAASAVSAQGVTGVLLPPTQAPAGCVATYSSQFEITVVLPSKKRDLQLEKRDACAGDGTLVAKLSNGILTDAKGRIGAIVANHQFQFDGPPAQTGSLYTGGWSICPNGSLAIGGSAVFYECLSGGFYNLYDKSIGGQCMPIEIDVIPCGAGGAAQTSDGQVQATSAGTRISQYTDGQVQATSAGAHVTQITDGQIQATSAASRKPVSQYTDGQLQAPTTGRIVSQITDGQIQAPTSKPAPVTTSKPAVVTQITDGQVQAPTTIITRAPVSQITDGQIQAPTSKPVVVTQISDGQIQAPNATATISSSRVAGGAGAAKTLGAQLLAGVAAAAGFAML